VYGQPKCSLESGSHAHNEVLDSVSIQFQSKFIVDNDQLSCLVDGQTDGRTDGQTLRWQRRASLRCAANKTNPIDVTECPQSIPITANRLTRDR